ncbi:MAG: methyltransferase domain-containing protein [Candidatus Aenigmarchaeota archaeon]|nr:methyltransferase domain-containing protein [Candidatus Aenigmarchaeota archaeon]NIP41059.1 methyltransferase domain-containing protein [Candidatus Aenigmarchaeota archaeon]NIQ17461.1 methyltransferase domain-containing protein [Candidatus Aenigmarchaeota archaeon]NIS73655.1 methyltransferase domain-containing protein [Candidatus Aenigmarchaeota archaeon]
MKNVFLFVLSGAHETLPLAELEAVLTLTSDFDLLETKENFAVYRTSRSGSRFLNTLRSRLVLTHSIHEFMGSFYWEDLEKFLDTLPRFETPYRVRVHLYERKERTETLEKQIGEMISDVIRKSGRDPSVSLENPNTSIEFFITENEVYCGSKLAEIEKKPFEARKPKKKPFVKPVSMDPRFARVMVNLSRTGEGRILDPFCGTGGILIEAGLVGLRIFGVDMEEEMVSGCKENLEFFKLKGEVKEGDARNLEKIFSRNFFDGIVTDPPYGRLSSTKGSDVEKLYNESVKSIEKVLKPRSFLVIATPTNINIKTKMKLIEIHRERINKSLERRIMVYRK